MYKATRNPAAPNYQGVGPSQTQTSPEQTNELLSTERLPPQPPVRTPVVETRIASGGRLATVRIDVKDPEARSAVKIACALHLSRAFPGAVKTFADSDLLHIPLNREGRPIEADDVNAVSRDMVNALQWLEDAGALTSAAKIFADGACADALTRLVKTSAVAYSEVTGVRVAPNLTAVQLADLATLCDALAPTDVQDLARSARSAHVAIALLHSAVLVGQAEDESALITRCIRLHGQYPEARLDPRVLSGLAGVIAIGSRDPALADACASLRDDVLKTIFSGPEHSKLKFFARPLLESRLRHLNERAAEQTEKRPNRIVPGKDAILSNTWRSDVEASVRATECDDATAQWLKRLWMDSKPSAADREWAMQQLSSLKGPHARAALLACKGMEADTMMGELANVALDQLADDGFTFELADTGEVLPQTAFDAARHGDLLIDYVAAIPHELRAQLLSFLADSSELSPRQASRVLRLFSTAIELESLRPLDDDNTRSRMPMLLEGWDRLVNNLSHSDPQGAWQTVVAAAATAVAPYSVKTARQLCQTWFLLSDGQLGATTARPLRMAAELELLLLDPQADIPANMQELMQQCCAEIEGACKEAMIFLQNARQKNPRLTLASLNDPHLTPSMGSLAHAMHLWDVMVRLVARQVLSAPAQEEALKLLSALMSSTAAQMLMQGAPKTLALVTLRLLDEVAAREDTLGDPRVADPLIDILCNWLGKEAPEQRQLPNVCARLIVRAVIDGPSLTYPEFRRCFKFVVSLLLETKNAAAAIELAIECMTINPLSAIMLVEHQNDIDGSRLAKKLLLEMILQGTQHEVRAYSAVAVLLSNQLLEFDGVKQHNPEEIVLGAAEGEAGKACAAMVLTWRGLQQQVLDKTSLINDSASAFYAPISTLDHLRDTPTILGLVAGVGVPAVALALAYIFPPMAIPIAALYAGGLNTYLVKHPRSEILSANSEEIIVRGGLYETGGCAALFLMADLQKLYAQGAEDPNSPWNSLLFEAHEAFARALESPVFEDGTPKPATLMLRHLEIVEILRK